MWNGGIEVIRRCIRSNMKNTELSPYFCKISPPNYWTPSDTDDIPSVLLQKSLNITTNPSHNCKVSLHPTAHPLRPLCTHSVPESSIYFWNHCDPPFSAPTEFHKVFCFTITGWLNWKPLIFKDSLRYLVQFSLKIYTQMILDACHSVMNVKENMKWPGDVLKSPYM